jgi:hypothetical protein
MSPPPLWGGRRALRAGWGRWNWLVMALSVFGLAPFQGFLRGTVPGVASQHPPAEPGHPQRRDQEGDAHPEPRWHPLAGKKDHA